MSNNNARFGSAARFPLIRKTIIMPPASTSNSLNIKGKEESKAQKDKTIQSRNIWANVKAQTEALKKANDQVLSQKEGMLHRLTKRLDQDLEFFNKIIKLTQNLLDDFKDLKEAVEYKKKELQSVDGSIVSSAKGKCGESSSKPLMQTPLTQTPKPTVAVKSSNAVYMKETIAFGKRRKIKVTKKFYS